MSYFAITRSPDGKPFEIVHCHLNLWMLPGLFGAKTFLDVGLHVRAKEVGVKTFSVALPFTSDALSDISQTLRDETTSQLIFRQPSRDGKLYFRGGNGVAIAALDIGKCKRLVTNNVQRSLWEMESADALAQGTEHYFRFRFVIRDCARVWNNKRHMALSYGGLLDFRIADTREVRGDARWDSVRDRIISIDSVQFFFIAEPTLQLRETSPIVYSTRIMEPNAWETYLRRRTYGRRMVIYGWEYPPESSVANTARLINEDAPYRIFADFSRDLISLSLQLALQNAVFISLLVFVGWIAWSWAASYMTTQAVSEQLTRYGGPITLIAFCAWLIKIVPALERIRAFLKAVIARVDSQIYDKR